MKKLDFLKIVIGLFLVVFAVSCNEDDGTTIATLEKQDVVFNITNVVQEVAGENAFFAAKGNADGTNSALPECSDLVPTHVNLVLDSGAAELAYTLQLVSLNGKTETEVLKLAPGDYKLTEFVVYSGTTPIWASPAQGSYYDLLWPQFNFTDVPFTVLPFDKVKVKVDVLCYEPYKYKEFGFVWFAYSKIEVKTICFFGDVCTKFFEEWHQRNEGNPYLGQAFNGYDFPAIFSVVVKNAQGVVVNDLEQNSNAAYFGIGSPLCIEYPDQVAIEGEIFTFELWLAMPDGSNELIYTGEFDDSAMSEDGNLDGFGGKDGIFDFVIGNCSYEGNDANLELPAYLPIPISANMTTSFGPQGFDLYEFYMTFSNYNPAPIVGLFEETTYRALCGEEEVKIIVPGNYFVEFYSSLDYLDANTLIPAPYNAYPWGSMNFLANNCDPYTWKEVQQAIWYIMDPINTENGVNNQLAQDALANPNFVPTVGDFACVLVVPFDAVTRQAEGNASQLLLMRVDP